MITKSGTNEFKGSAFEFFNSDALNARPYFATAKTPLDRNIFGGTIGGPIRKNSLFFFGSYEGFFDRSTTQQFNDVPTAGDAQRRLQRHHRSVIYDPSTGNADGTGRTPFAGNQIPWQPPQLDRAEDQHLLSGAEPAGHDTQLRA